ncbi:MAG: hypothetical protein MZV70_40090 [Desulfobacterales bacterium]|nr:hypothetical protein [Desulfobacterales bacterium]
MEKTWDRSRDLVIFDELHKMKNWKSWLKGIYDTERIPPPSSLPAAQSLMPTKRSAILLPDGFSSLDSIPSI